MNPQPLHYKKVLKQSDLLLLKVLQANDTVQQRKNGKEVLKFLSEDEIIHRTRDWSNYFANHVNVLSAIGEVKNLLKIFLHSKMITGEVPWA